MEEDIHEKMKAIMYHLTRNAAQLNYKDFLEDIGISGEDYKKIKIIWKEKLNIEPYV